MRAWTPTWTRSPRAWRPLKIAAGPRFEARIRSEEATTLTLTRPYHRRTKNVLCFSEHLLTLPGFCLHMSRTSPISCRIALTEGRVCAPRLMGLYHRRTSGRPQSASLPGTILKPTSDSFFCVAVRLITFSGRQGKMGPSAPPGRPKTSLLTDKNTRKVVKNHTVNNNKPKSTDTSYY